MPRWVEGALPTSPPLQASFPQIERLGYRLLDWSDFRVYRVQGSQVSLVFRSSMGQPNRAEPPQEMAALRQEVLESREPLVLRDTRKDDRVAGVLRHAQSLVIHPIKFGDEILGL